MNEQLSVWTESIRSQIEDIVGYRFTDASLLRQAFTHSSYANEFGVKSNETMEFLGDAILGFVVAEFLFKQKDEEGTMSLWRSNNVSKPALTRIVLSMELEKYILLGRSQRRQDITKGKICSNLYEAVVCAMYLDGGMDKAREFIYKTLGERLTNAGSATKDAKTRLNEYCNAHKCTVSYVCEQSGYQHNPVFTAVCLVDGVAMGNGSGASKTVAEERAAQCTLEALSIQHK